MKIKSTQYPTASLSETELTKAVVTCAAIIVLLLFTASCSENKPVISQDKFSQRDPVENLNRNTFLFNKGFDEYFLKPVSECYAHIPEGVKGRISNILNNLEQPANFVNGTLQLNPRIMATSFWRFVINTTIGIGGINDIASLADLKDPDQSFSKTLASYNVGEGPYLIIPFVGPSTMRGTAGLVVDSFIDPLDYFLPATASLAQTSVDAVSAREDNSDIIDQFYYKSLEPYSATRAAYLQHQAFEWGN